MKSDPLTLVLGFVLAALVALTMVFAIITNLNVTKLPTLTVQAQQAGGALMRLQALGNDVAAFNSTAKSPELTHILQAAQAKPAATK
jgi:hypothetical protein